MINRHGPAPVCCPHNRPRTFGRPGAKFTRVTPSAPSDLSSSARSCAKEASAPVTLGVPMKRRNNAMAASSLRDDRRRETSVGSICILQRIASLIVPRTTTPAHSNLIGSLPPSTYPQRLTLPEPIIPASFQKQPITNLDYCVGKGLGCLLRKIVSRIDDAMFMQSGKHAGVLCGPTRLERVGRAVDRHRRHLHRGLLRQKVFERLQRRVARLKAKGAAVTMDHDIHEIRIFESDRGPSERRFIESPTGRPLAP